MNIIDIEKELDQYIGITKEQYRIHREEIEKQEKINKIKSANYRIIQTINDEGDVVWYPQFKTEKWRKIIWKTYSEYYRGSYREWDLKNVKQYIKNQIDKDIRMIDRKVMVVWSV